MRDPVEPGRLGAGLMSTDEDQQLPVGLGGLRYPITQLSLVVQDIDALMDRYHRAFGWAPWQDFDHVPPTHHNTQHRGELVEYSLRGAEVYVGSLNFELLKPLPGGESVFHDHLSKRGEGPLSIASMFHDRTQGDAVKEAFSVTFGLGILTKAEIGDHIEYYYLDTQPDFGCPIESGSGHAIDFHPASRVYPSPTCQSGPAPDSGVTYSISQITLVVDDLESKAKNFGRGFGWNPWSVFDSRQPGFLSATQFRGEAQDFDLLVAQTQVGDLNFEIVQPRGGKNPWKEHLDRNGDSLMGLAVTPHPPNGIEEVKASFESQGIHTVASARVGGSDWMLLDTEAHFKMPIAVALQHAYQAATPVDIWNL
jgi:hypothetical protein